MRQRTLTRLLAILMITATAGTITGCGKQTGGSPTVTTSYTAPPAQKGYVIHNPTTAQSFIYLPQTAVQESNGDILITDGGNWDRSGAKIVEMNPQGKPIWVYTGGMDFPHSAYPVGNNILISDTNNNRVFMINRQGKIIWTTDTLGKGNGHLGTGTFSDGGHLLYPNDAIMMPHNNVLISSRMNSSIWQIDMKGHVTWSCKKFMFRQHRPRFLPNGTIMVPDSDHGRVIIINHACTKIVFNYGGLDSSFRQKIIWPRTFDTYPGPHGKDFLIGDSRHNRVLVISPQKKIIRQWTNIPGPYYLQSMSNGNILMGNTGVHGAIVLGAHGGIVKTYSTTDPTKYPTSVVNGSFETANSSGTPTGWLKGDQLNETLLPGQRADMRQVTNEAHTGKASAMISWPSNTSHLFLVWQQTVAVTPGKSYKFTGWIKTKDVGPCTGCDFGTGTQPFYTANYYVTYVKPNYPYGLATGGFDPGGQYSTGTQQWTPETQTFVDPPGVTHVTIQGILLGRGTVWFDDVSLKPA